MYILNLNRILLFTKVYRVLQKIGLTNEKKKFKKKKKIIIKM